MKRRSSLWVVIVCLWGALIALAWFMSQNGRFGRTDFEVYYRSARLLLDGQPLYHGTVEMVYLYPPLLAQTLMPLATAVDAPTAWVIWFSLNTGLLVGAVGLLSDGSPRPYWLWLITPLFLPALEALYIGQVTMILLALFTGAWWAIRHERRFLAGLLLALAAWIKVYPALLIVYCLWKRDWRAVSGALAGGLGLGLLQLVVSGPTPLLSMFAVFFSLAESGQSQLIAENASLYGFVSQLFQAHPNVAPLVINPLLYGATRLLLTAGLVGGLVYVTARRRDFDLEYGLAVLTALLLSPTLFPAGMAPVLLTFALLLRRHPAKSSVWLTTSAGVVLSLYWLYVIGYSGSPPVSGLLLSFGFYALIVTWGVNAYRLWQRPPTTQP